MSEHLDKAKFPHKTFWAMMGWYFMGRFVSDVVAPFWPYWVTLIVYGLTGVLAYHHARYLEGS